MKKYLILAALLLSSVTLAIAEIPNTIHFQGRLTSTTGTPVTDASYGITFQLWDAETSGTMVWSGSYNVSTKSGYYNAELGSGAHPFSGSMTFNDPYYLDMQISGDPQVLAPRIKINSVAFAIRAKTSVEADAATIAANVVDNSITTNKIVDGSITSADIGAGEVGLANMAADAVLPIGSIIAWHNAVYGSLPVNWVACNGGTVNDPTSPINGQSVPDLNNTGRFLRGAPTTSGQNQEDAFQGHVHVARTWDGAAGAQWVPWTQQGNGVADNTSYPTGVPMTDGANGTPRTSTETRPKNMGVIWIMKIK